MMEISSSTTVFVEFDHSFLGVEWRLLQFGIRSVHGSFAFFMILKLNNVERSNPTLLLVDGFDFRFVFFDKELSHLLFSLALDDVESCRRFLLD